MVIVTPANQLINSALRLIGQLAEDETPTAATANDALAAFNQMVDSWNTESLMIYNTQDQVFSWPPGAASLTFGPTGTAGFGFNRPIAVDDSTYFLDPQNGVSYGIKIINQQQYNGIAVKTVTSTYPQVLWVNMEYPDIVLTIYPVPTRLLTWHLVSVALITEPVGLTTDIVLPPGYIRAFRYNLAMEIANEFGVEPMPQTQRIAMTSKRNLKRINKADDLLSMPYSLIATRQRFNIYAGNY